MPLKPNSSQRHNRTRAAILGVLSRRTASGYEIRQCIARTVGHFWQESVGQLYPTLSALVREGLIEVVDNQGHGDRRCIRYGLTHSGRMALAQWIEQAPSASVERNELLLKVFFADKGNLEVVERHLVASLSEAQKQRDVLASLAKETFANEEPRDVEGLLGWLTLQYGRVMLAANISWCEDALDRLRSVQRKARRPAPGVKHRSSM